MTEYKKGANEDPRPKNRIRRGETSEGRGTGENMQYDWRKYAGGDPPVPVHRDRVQLHHMFVRKVDT